MDATSPFVLENKRTVLSAAPPLFCVEKGPSSTTLRGGVPRISSLTVRQALNRSVNKFVTMNLGTSLRSRIRPCLDIKPFAVR